MSDHDIKGELILPKKSLKPHLELCKKDHESSQLSFFADFLTSTALPGEHLSNMFEIWEFLPKYHMTRQRQSKIKRQGDVLPSLQRTVTLPSGETVEMTMSPAVIRNPETGKDEYFYPSEREEIIEAMLHKMATYPYKGGRLGFCNKNKSGVIFSMQQLRKELENVGHGYRLREIKEAFYIMAHTIISIRGKLDGQTLKYTGPVIAAFYEVDREQYLSEDGEVHCQVVFNSMIQDSIEALNYYQYDFHTFNQLPTQLSRWLFKRLALRWRYADLGPKYGYHINLSTVKNDSGLIDYDRISYSRRELEKALDALKEHDVIWKWTPQEKKEGRQLKDVTYNLEASIKFKDSITMANKRRIEPIDKKVVRIAEGRALKP